MSERTCSVEGCEQPIWIKKRRLCCAHGKRFYKYGDPLGGMTPICRTCGVEFKRPGRSGVLPFYCSRECRPREWRQDRPSVVSCEFCGTEFDRNKTRARFCSMSCWDRYRRSGGAIIDRRCVQCMAPIDYEQQGRAGRKRRLDARRCTSCRRVASYPLTVADLAARDGVNCSICSALVDMATKWPDRWSPTIDHVVPVSRGGTNDAENLALAHFVCNIKKRDKALA